MRMGTVYFSEGVSDKIRERFLGPWCSRGEDEEWHLRSTRVRDTYYAPESNSNDIIDLLPSDPFGMDIKTTFTAITGWLEDLEVECLGCTKSNDGSVRQEKYDLSGWNLIWNDTLKHQPFHNNIHFNERSENSIQLVPCDPKVGVEPHISIHHQVQHDENMNAASKGNNCWTVRDMKGALAPYAFRFQPGCANEGSLCSSDENSSCSSELHLGQKIECASEHGGPHEALFFSLNYLGVKDLLLVERVCRSLCCTVRGDPLLWRSIHIDQPLNERVTDDHLLQLVRRAQGNLQCLSLVECPKVTDDGLRRIFEANPRLTKLSVPGCTRLSVEGILDNIKTHNSKKDLPGIKQLRIGGLYGVTHEHFEEFKLLLDADSQKPKGHQKPHIYQRGNFYLPYDDDRAIDIEMCPACEKFRLVYDCPSEGCQAKYEASHDCRGCALCIARCVKCGRCINDNEYEETFCLELLCADCFKQLLLNG